MGKPSLVVEGLVQALQSNRCVSTHCEACRSQAGMAALRTSMFLAPTPFFYAHR